MPIDFNPYSLPNNNNLKPKINIPFLGTFKQKPDTFVKTVKTDENKITGDYQGITISEKSFGTIKKTGEDSKIYTITNKNGASVQLSTFGATIVSIKIPDKNGVLTDITQGYNNVTPYETAPIGHAGGTIGPCANKIYGGEFIINNKKYSLETNKDNGKTHCHGGSDGYDVKNWKAKVLTDGIEFSYTKKDMESGYPGNVKVKVTYKFDNNNNLRIIYSEKTDKDTLLNMTNHSYFNLDGEENAQENSVLNHIVELPNSDYYTKNNELAIPTGEFVKIEKTPFDFKTPHKIGARINDNDEQLKIVSGYDQNYCINNYDGKTLINIANAESEKTGIKLSVSTNLPGFQFYTANHLGKTAQPEGKSGKRYEKRSAFCIEPQFYPNAINTEEFSEKGILKKGEQYNREIVYSFGINK